MALHIRDEETDRLVRRLAAHKGLGLTEAIRIAVQNELGRIPLSERLKPLQERIVRSPETGLAADKAFFDGLDGLAP
jgi:antitoxin VapB